MAQPREDQLSVTEDEGRYVRSTEGPTDDTTVHTRNTPGIAPEVVPPVRARANEVTPDPDMTSLRQSVRKPEEVERERPRRARPWSPFLTSVVVFVIIVGIGTIGLLAFLQRDRAPEQTIEAPQGPTEIGGVPVRKGMKGGG